MAPPINYSVTVRAHRTDEAINLAKADVDEGFIVKSANAVRKNEKEFTVYLTLVRK
jgi:hypothetical protein